MPSSQPSGMVTFLFTDVEGSTRLWEEHPADMRTALARHDELLREVFDSHRGYRPALTARVFTLSTKVVSDPEFALAKANEIAEKLNAAGVVADWMVRLLEACAGAACGETALARAQFADAERRLHATTDDDGLPDLLLPLALLAWSRGDPHRAARLVTAVRNSPRKTQNFLSANVYRELRAATGLADDDPLADATLEELLAESKERLGSL
ncbi:MAG: adenylate/guanylate cyclase domain-containing protein [Acidimicrobiia bacterium]